MMDRIISERKLSAQAVKPSTKLVSEMRFELTRPISGHRHLKPARLPIPPLRLINYEEVVPIVPCG